MSIIIADSNDLTRVGLRSILSTQTSISIVGEASDGNELMNQLNSFDVSMVLIDYTSPGFTIDTISEISSFKKEIKFIAITPEQSAQTLVDALRSGIMSYVKKDCDLSEIVNAVLETRKGNKFFCGQILETIQKAQIDVNDLDFDSFTCEAVVLSERENEIIVLISEGYTNNKIADLLFLSNHTITTHRKNIMSKLGVKNTAGIVMYAVKTNLVSPNKFLFAPSS
ncbi:response regulator transcription factor [Crocinitomicaceae bacterium]|jgi:DNA-binding NarL/FixJ family response regulator|nr:response regulator transcription factor [Crocinitomicaceae bacterium]MDA8910533.1 response regulator transcription factor [Crocinitomicaceae bacterium]MDB4340186.1 response regulator transcription factor [Crocinitomicaceae bacterium]MDC3308776.1 response regulator transcription factor [Crocinitomicaceae bacterium]MDO7610109.1 response regulator transcription factor [Crocinitomicaceae bacterium]